VIVWGAEPTKNESVLPPINVDPEMTIGPGVGDAVGVGEGVGEGVGVGDGVGVGVGKPTYCTVNGGEFPPPKFAVILYDPDPGTDCATAKT